MPTLNPCQQRVSGFLVSYRPTRHIICKKSSGGRPKSPGLDTCPKASSDAARPASVPTSAGYKELKWTWNAHEISYVTAGCGRPIVLIHGFGASYGHYRQMIPVLVDKGFKVYAIDLLGFGASSKPFMDYTMELWDQLVRDFTEEFIDQPAVFVGNSVGSLASLMVGANAPERVRGIVLLNCAGGMNNKAIVDDWRIKLVMPIFLLIDFLLKKPKIARYIFDNVRTKENLRKALLSVYPGNAAAVDEELVEMLHVPSCDAGALDVFVSVITGPPGPRPEQLIPQIKAPMLILWGEKDPFTPFDGPVGKYFQGLPSLRDNVSFVSLPGVGHCPMDEAPEAVHASLLPWLEQYHNNV